MTEQQQYIEAMRKWFANEDNQNNITRSNIENAKQMIKFYTIELKNKEEQLEFDLNRLEKTKADYAKWCADNMTLKP